MPPSKGPIWKHFLPGEKQNGSHLRAHCLGCIEKQRPAGVAIEFDDEGKAKLLLESWVTEGEYHIPVQAWTSLTFVYQHAKPELVAYLGLKTQ